MSDDKRWALIKISRRLLLFLLSIDVIDSSINALPAAIGAYLSTVPLFPAASIGN